MFPTRRPSVLLTISAAVTFFLCALPAWAAPKYKVLHAFTGGNDGGGLWGSLVLDLQGNVYGTTVAGGPNGGGGTVFRLTRRANGTWGQTVLYSFCSQSECTDGGGSTAGLIFDAVGNLYGTTMSGGAHAYGTVFELTPESGGWAETVLYSFPRPPTRHGCCPYAGLAIDSVGNLYGTAGYPFELSLGSDGWTETALHKFVCGHGDGCEPFAGVILDSAGNLYGTTELGGSSQDCGGGCGIAYQLKPVSGGKWKETILHSFGSFKGDGIGPGVGALAIDASGNVYGTTDVGGPAGYGTVFKLTPKANGRWKETILHSFTQGANGDHVSAGVVFDQAGNLYGTTIGGGTQCDCGVVYKLAPQSSGKWKYTVLHRFTGADGAQPDANLIVDDKGNLYGTTATGGAGGAGVVFEVTP
jgi:uncharacterized repeat protein (TIGR03803 family)